MLKRLEVLKAILYNTGDLYYYCICSNCIVYMDKAFYEPEHRKTNFNAVG